jgi:hypothetical protein
MNNETIILNQKDLWEYILKFNWHDRNAFSDEDIHVMEQIRRFFSANLHLIRYATDIVELVLTPRGKGELPLAQVNIIYQHRLYRLTSDENGCIPQVRT